MNAFAYIAVVYWLIGEFLALCITPDSWPMKRNAWQVRILWPWLVAAFIAMKITGRVPQWGPRL